MADKIKTLIVDDEPLARRNLRLLLEKDPQIVIIEECRNGRESGGVEVIVVIPLKLTNGSEATA